MKDLLTDSGREPMMETPTEHKSAHRKDRLMESMMALMLVNQLGFPTELLMDSN